MKKLLALFLLTSSLSAADLGQLYVTTADGVRTPRNELVKPATSAPDFTVDLARRQQTITGFGGAFNEQGWAALLALDAASRKQVVKNLFSPSEANLGWGRIPIGASDYALARYTLNQERDDFAMKSFTLEQDQKYLIPYLKAALEVRPDMQFWGSAWTPPTWMKSNNLYEGGKFKDKDVYYQAYALYLARFAEDYTKQGIIIKSVAIQNEPTVVTGYPNGGWTPEQFRKFLADFAGPLFKDRKVAAKLMLGTLNEGDYTTYAKTVLDDPKARQYVASIGLQWDGDKQIPSIKQFYPEIPIMQTETDCGNWTWLPGFNRDHASNDFSYGAYTWGRIRDYLVAGAESYMLWNLVLDQDGKNIDKYLKWPQNSAIVVNTTTHEVTYTPMFRAFEHFTRYVPVGSKVLQTTGAWKNLVAFERPDGTKVIELLNSEDGVKTVTGSVGGATFSIDLPAKSFSTLVLK